MEYSGWGGRVFQAEGTAGAKALRHESGLCGVEIVVPGCVPNTWIST